MAIKGQKFKSYAEEVKVEAVRLHFEEKWTYRQITEHFQIQDKDRVKRWVSKYRKLGEFGLLDQRGRREEYQDQDRYVSKLLRENEVLKKCLEIWKQEEWTLNIRSLRGRRIITPLQNCVGYLMLPEVATTLI